MVFYLTAQDHKYLLNRILPLAREVGVSQELRGWSWYKEPLKPYHPERISMFSVCGRFCESGRDVYLTYVEKKQPRRTREILLGASVHNMLEHLFTEARRGNFASDFQSWWAGEAEGKKQEFEDVDSFAPLLRSLWDF